MKYLRGGLILIALALAAAGVARAAIVGGEMSAPLGGQAGATVRFFLPLIFTPSATPGPGGWLTLLDEGFERTPAAGWRFFDRNGPTSGEYFWASRNCRPLTGTGSAWAVGGGANGAGLPCNGAYPDNADSWMVYGPFSLADAQMAQMRFSFYANNLAEGDTLCWGASDDDVNLSGLCLDIDPGGWTPFILDLGNLFGDQPPSVSFLGKPQVWIGFRFLSDATGHAAEGVYLDNVVVRKCPNLACANLPTAAAPRFEPAFMKLRQ